MKHSNIIKAFASLCVLAAWNCVAQPFTSGSDGSYGPLHVTGSSPLQLPPDGIYHCTTITVNGGATLNFIGNALNTPVYLLATGDVIINGNIDVSGSGPNGSAPGRGGPGGFDGGFYCCGAGHGPGGGLGSLTAGAAHVVASGSNSNTYGNVLLTPLIGGSGGAAGTAAGAAAGGGGGGAILIASSTRITINGDIYARGKSGNGGGSGGAIRIVAPVVAGGGRLFVEGGYGSGGQNGSYGRIRIDSLDRFARANFTLSGKSSFGSQMFVFPTGLPRLDIVQAAGLSIPEGTTNSVSINLPAGASTNQLVRVQARGLTNDIPITVVVTPDYGSAVQYPAVIQNTGNPSFVDVNIVLPYDVVTHIHAWTR